MDGAGVKQRWPRALALEVCRELVRGMRPACEPERLLVAGSLRRRKKQVGDIELVYVPRMVEGTSGDFFEAVKVPAVDAVIAQWEAQGVLEKRVNKKGATMFGSSNKLMRHVATGIPVDLFATEEKCWWNYVVCRTGSAENNVQIAEAARKKGWGWKPYDSGFVGPGRKVHRVTSERDVYEFVGLDYREPWER